MVIEAKKHATIKLADVVVHASHPFRNKNSHDALLEYCRHRLIEGKQFRDSQIKRYAQIDKDIAGWIKQSDEDRKRDSLQRETGIPQATAVNLPINFIHLDDMMTYYAGTFAPTQGMFYHTGKPDEIGPANQIVSLMNNHAIYGGYYRQTLAAIFTILKYNVGGFYGTWATDFGPRLETLADGKTVANVEPIWSGNKLESLDMYNTFWDPSVNPTQVYKDAEWAGKTYMRSHYWLANKAQRGVYFNCDEALRTSSGVPTSVYYRHPPTEAKMNRVQDANGADWISILSESPEYARVSGFEITEICIRLNPVDFGLVEPKDKVARSRYELWKITILNDMYVIGVDYLNNVHDHIPYYFGFANDDIMGTSQKAVSEMIQPLQNFASSLLNSHIKSTRKNLFGTTYYDPAMFDMSKIPEGEVNARVPMKAQARGKDIRTGIYRDNQILDTKQTLTDLGDIIGIIDQFFPTQSLPSQIASIDRAVDSQVAAVQQGANRRQHKSARLLDDSLMRPMRTDFYYNIIQYQTDGETISDFYGKETAVNLGELRKTDLPFVIGMGIKALDRQATAQSLQQIIFALIQNPQAAQSFDLPGLINYWSSMIDMDIDMTQFKLAPPEAQQPPAPDGSVTGVGATATSTGVVPATDPANVTGPLY